MRDLAVADDAGALDLKGKQLPVRAFRLVDVAATGEGPRRRLDSPMIGRERERRLLQEGFDRAVSNRSCHLFTLIGPAGVGKSRLVRDFVDGLAGRARVLGGRCLSYGEGITFRPVVEVVQAAAGIEESDSAEQARRRIEALVDGLPAQEQIAERLAQVLGLGSASASSEEVFWAIRRTLEALAEPGPLVVVFDDIHWAEPALLDLIDHVADWTRDAPLLLVCLARHELLDQRPTWAGGKLNATTLLLEPLDETESAGLIEGLLGGASLSQDVRRKIVEAADGNPLFVEEMLAMLIDDGFLGLDGGRWVPSADLSAIAVPASIHALISARLDRLMPEEREVIERGAVEGKVFHRGAVAALCPEERRSGVPAHLMGLARKDLIRPQRPDFAGEDAFRFRHLLIRDAAYEALPKETRAELHERFAQWLETVAGDRLPEYEEIVGYHLEQAVRYREELGVLDEQHHAVAGRAAGLLLTAGRRALDRSDLN
ncbi:MAG TPA: AAA family ATPase, partial [Actinomycetota bacterium]|nr:AAA family ATPase [Actinomycetota bacterium]